MQEVVQPSADVWAAKIKRYIESPDAQKKLNQIIQELIAPVFAVDLDYLRREDPDLCYHFLSNPTIAIAIAEKFLGEAITSMTRNSTFLLKKLRVAFVGNFGSHNLSPRGLKCSFVCKLVRVQGVVVSSSSVRSQLVQSTHYCAATQQFISQEFSDQLGLRNISTQDTRNFLPATDANDNPLTIEFGLCNYKDVQILQIQEMPENVPSGLLSRSVELLLQEDLVDSVKPGDRVEVVGILRAQVGLSGILTGLFATMIQTFSISLISDKTDIAPTPAEMKEIKALSKRTDVIDVLRRSLAPSLHGLDGPKEAILLMLVGGEEKTLPGGIRLRGDINVLLVGDPSTAKSQLLRRAMTLNSSSFSATGRGSTGVGLTAAITVDRETRERKLEAGAMVLADRGLLCVDEFDKMAESDRVAMHEAMEQQTVSLAKAGVQVCLNARCTILAAANPTYGSYITSLSHSRNIGLPESLLSRFDLIFIILDIKSPENDREVAQRVTTNHRTQSFNYDISDLAYTRPSMSHARGGENITPLLTATFLKKYLNHVKEREPPSLNDESSSFLRENWKLLRQFDFDINHQHKLSHILPVSIRSLESLIRLSTAYAKLRLSPQVSQIDCARAVNIFLQGFYGGFENERVAERFVHIQELCQSSLGGQQKRKGGRKRKNSIQTSVDNPERSRSLQGESSSQRITRSRFIEERKEEEKHKKVFKAFIDLTQQRKEPIPFEDFWSYIEANNNQGVKYGLVLENRAQLEFILDGFSQKNQILVASGIIYKI